MSQPFQQAKIIRDNKYNETTYLRNPTMKNQKKIEQIFELLFQYYGDQFWWPAKSTSEIFLGAILTQGTTWKNAEKALSKLSQNSDLSIESIDNMSITFLEETIRSSGYFRAKTRTIKQFIGLIKNRYDSDFDYMQSFKTELLRLHLLSIKGIGEETADAMLLYGLNKPTFVIDNFTMRIISRIGLLSNDSNYNDFQRLFTQNLAQVTTTFQQFHALLVKHAQTSCLKTKPKCRNCCLKNLCTFGRKNNKS